MAAKKGVPREISPGFPYRVVIQRRPTCPSLVGKTGTAVNDTLDEQIRVEVDLASGAKWLRTILVLPEDIRRLEEGSPQVVA